MNEVYVELIWIENFLLDFVILLLSMRLSQKRTSFVRCAAGGAAGGVYAVFAALYPFLRGIPFKLLSLAIMAAAVFLPSSWRAYLRFGGYVLFVSAVFGGGGAMAYYALGSMGVRTAVSGQVMAVCGLGISLAVVAAEIVIRRKNPEMNKVYHVRATILGEQVAFDAMLDTGNDVRDFSGNGVIFADEDTFFGEISDGLKESILQMDGRVMVRPFYCSTIDGPGRHLGVMPDETSIQVGGDEYAAKAYILLGKNIKLGDCRGILGNGLVIDKRR